jgi:hypothetical protein
VFAPLCEYAEVRYGPLTSEDKMYLLKSEAADMQDRAMISRELAAAQSHG